MTPQIQVTGAYLQHSAELCSYAANPALVGNFLPQVLQNQFSFQASYLGMEWNAGLQGWFGGQQFDDDQNLLPLGREFTLDGEVSPSIAGIS